MISGGSSSDRPPVPEQPPADFAEFYRETVVSTYRLVRCLARDEHWALDAMQEAYARMLERWSERRERSREDNLGYTMAIARNLVRDWYRDSARHRELDDEVHGSQDDPRLVAVLDELSLFKTVRTLIDGLPSRRRAVAMLYFLDECTYREIAQNLAITESTVRTQIERVRVLLTPHLERFAQLKRGDES